VTAAASHEHCNRNEKFIADGALMYRFDEVSDTFLVRMGVNYFERSSSTLLLGLGSFIFASFSGSDRVSVAGLSSHLAVGLFRHIQELNVR
jgi:hypothetical protein